MLALCTPLQHNLCPSYTITAQGIHCGRIKASFHTDQSTTFFALSAYLYTMCQSKIVQSSLMAAAKEEPDNDVLEQDEPSSTGTECAFCTLILPALAPASRQHNSSFSTKYPDEACERKTGALHA